MKVSPELAAQVNKAIKPIKTLLNKINSPP